MRIDWSVVDEAEDVRTVPVGAYDVRIAEVREGQTRDGSARWGLRLEVVQGDFAGKLAAWDSLIWSERGKPRAKRVLTALGLPVEGEVDLEPGALQGRRGRVEVIVEEYERANGILARRMAVPYNGWAPAGAGVDGDEETREALGRDSPF